MKHIVVTTDFTAASRNAVIYAAELAKTTNARLHIYHAYHTPVVTAEVPVMPDMEEFEAECYKKL